MRWLLAAGLLACVAELGLRFGVGLGDPPLVEHHPEIEYRLLPSREYTRFGNRISVNRLGMRSPDISETPQANENRILLIGDSVIYGNHFLDQTETIASRLTEMLRRIQPSCQTTTLAAAASSWGPVNQAAYLSDIGPVGADLAVLIVSSHDLYDTPSPRGHVIPYRLSKPIGAIGDAVQIIVERAKRQFLTAPPPAPRSERRFATLAALDRMADQFKAAGVPLILAYHPIVPERRTGPNLERAEFERWAKTRGVEFQTLDLDDFNDSFYRDHIHPSAEGAARIADKIQEFSIHYLPHCDIN